ncbi:MAG: ATP-binding protein [Anaerolineae bacterium]
MQDEARPEDEVEPGGQEDLPGFPEPEDRPRTSMLMRLLLPYSGRRILDVTPVDMGFAEQQPYPFLALVGQVQMRTALLLTVINPNVGGVLLIGPRGTGKTTAARGLSDLLPHVLRSRCLYGDPPAECELMGENGICDTCRANLHKPETLSYYEPVRMVELPLNARLEDVVGGINERIAIQENRIRLDRGILSRADQNILYVDEVNLLSDEIIDAILDAAAQGQYTVRRGPMRATYRARFVLIGSMNPEEGTLRPQILDRFGLRVLVSGLTEPKERLQVYQNMLQFRSNPRLFSRIFEEATADAREEVAAAREMLPQVTISQEAQELGLELVKELRIHSQRAEFTMFEAARAYAAADARMEATVADLRAVAPMALQMRRSEFIDSFIALQSQEEEQILTLFDRLEGSG